MSELDGLTVLITGGASGIGAACARLFTERGARVAILDVSAPESSADLVSVRADLVDDEAVGAAVADAAGRLGGIDMLVNNAGTSAVGTVADNSDAEWQRVLDVNVIGVVRSSRAALPHLRRSRSPAIVNTSSIAATAGLVNRALYSASKGAVHALTLAMAADLVGDGIRVNCVAPGTVDTPWVARLLAATEDPVAEKAALAARQPTGRLVTAEEVAAAVVYLASPASGATTGSSLAVDGGMSGLRVAPRRS